VKTCNRLLAISAILILCWFAVGCSSSSPKKTSGGVQFTAPATTPLLELTTPPETVMLTANQPVNWSFQPGTGCATPQGTLSTSQGASTTYTAPSTNTANCFSGPLSISVLATSVADSTQSAILVVNVVRTSPTVVPAQLFFSGIGGASDQYFTSCAATAPAGTLIPPSYALQANGAVAQIGSFYQATFGIQGYNTTPPSPGGVPPFTWTMTGSLPAGISMSSGTDSSSVVISGTPVSAGCDSTTTFTLQAADANGVASPVVNYGIVVIPASLKLSNSAVAQGYDLPGGNSGGTGVPYLPTSFTASGGHPPYSWIQYSPDQNFPPPGLNLAAIANGSNVAVLTGMPAASSANLSYEFQLQVNDSQQPYPAMFISNQIGASYAIQPQFCTQGSGGVIQANTFNGGVVGKGAVNTSSYMQGQFAFQLRGFDASGNAMVGVGSVNLDGNGNITGGEEDLNTSTGHRLLTVQPGSSYIVGVQYFNSSAGAVASYNRGCMILNLQDASGSLTSNFAFTAGGCSNHFQENSTISTAADACGMTQSNNQNVAAGQFTFGRLIEFDCSPGSNCTGEAGARASGIMRLQNSSAFAGAPAGPYTFGMSGQDAAAGHFAMAGSLQANGGDLSSIAADVNDAGTLSSSLTGGSGTYTSADSNGRITASISVGQTSIDVAGYVVASNEVMLATTDTLAQGQPLIGGEAISSATNFNMASIQNSHMFHLGGITSGSPDVSIGTLSFDGVGSFTGTETEDQAGTIGTNSLSGTYAVDGNSGRAILQPPQNQTLGAHPFVAYVIPVSTTLDRTGCSASEASCVTGFLVGTDSSAQDGLLEFQTALVAPPPPFNNLFVTGDYQFGTDAALTPNTPTLDGTGFAAVNSSNTTSGSLRNILQDVSFGDPTYCLLSSCYQLLSSEALSGSYSVSSNGTGSFGNGKASVTNGRVVFYIDESTTSKKQGTIVLDPQPSIVVAEQ